MNSFDPDSFEIKFKIADAAVEQYQQYGDDFTLKEVAETTDLTVANIFEYFPNKRAILLFYYEALIARYRLMLEEIEGFDDYLLAEKLSNFAYTSFDMLGEREAFVENTFKKLILCSYSTTGFEKRIEELLEDFLTNDSRISGSATMLLSSHTYSLLRKKYLALIRFWLKDESEGKELSMEITDKYTAFLQEILYSSTVDRGLDLAKFLFSNNIITSGFQSIKNLFPEIEIRD